MSKVKFNQSTKSIEINFENVGVPYSKALYNLMYALNEAGKDEAMEARFIADFEAEHPGVGDALGRAIQADFYTLKAELDAQAKVAAIAEYQAEHLDAAAGPASSLAAIAEGSVSISSAAAPAAGASSSGLPLRLWGTLASDELGILSSSPSTNSALTLADVQRVHGNGATTVLSKGGAVTPEGVPFLVDSGMKILNVSVSAAGATLPESEISVLPAAASASEEAAPAGEVATLTGEEALPAGE